MKLENTKEVKIASHCLKYHNLLNGIDSCYFILTNITNTSLVLIMFSSEINAIDIF